MRMPPRVHTSSSRSSAPLCWRAAACRALGIAPYKIEIQQGNFVSQEMASQLKEGMSKDQVRQIMGTPLLVDIFHAERWDYVYSRADHATASASSASIAIFFEDGKLARVDGDACRRCRPRPPAR